VRKGSQRRNSTSTPSEEERRANRHRRRLEEEGWPRITERKKMPEKKDRLLKSPQTTHERRHVGKDKGQLKAESLR